MITLVVFVIIALVLGGLLGTLLMRDPGYVLVVYDGMTMETSLWMGVLLILLLAVLARLIAWSLRTMLRSHGVLSAWLGNQRRESSQRMTEHGLMLLAEGRYREAWSALRDGARGAEFPLLNHLDAARAAQAMGDAEARDRCFDEAVQAQPNAAFAVAVTKAAMQQDHNQWAQSVRTLEAWRERAPRHPTLQAMLLRAHGQLHDWDAVHELLPNVVPGEFVSRAEYDEIKAAAWLGKLHGVTQSEQADTHARALWKRIPGDVKERGEVLSAYVNILRAAGDAKTIEEVLRKAIKRALTRGASQGFECGWIALYGQTVADADRQIEAVRDWLAQVRNAEGDGGKGGAEAALLCALAQLKEARGDADAQGCYEQSLAIDPTPAARMGLARTLIAAGATAQAAQTLADGG